MSSKTDTTAPATPKKPTQDVTITQQSVNLMRQIVNATGWAKTVEDIYVGGVLLADILPELDPIDWLKSPQEVAAMTDDERKRYIAKDKKWTSKICSFTLTGRQVKAFKLAFETLVAKGDLGPNTYLTELIKTFDFKVDSED